MADNTEGLVAQVLEGLDPGAMVIKYVIVIEAMDTDGKRSMWQVPNDGAMIYDSLSLLVVAAKIEESKIIKHKLQEDE